MIIKIDHIAFSPKNFEKDMKMFKKLGYSVKFEEKNIKNLEIKKDLVKDYSRTQSLTFLESEDKLDIEIIDQGKVNENKGFIDVSEDFKSIIIRVKDLKKSIEFWKLLGLKVVKKEKNQVLMNFNSPFSTHDILLKKTNNSENFLDDYSFNCIAFISSSVKNEFKKFQKYWRSSFEKIRVNNKNLELFFVKGPSNEIIEILELC